MTIDANDLEKIAKERPDECFLKGSGVLKLIGAIRQLESEARRATVSDAQPVAPNIKTWPERIYLQYSEMEIEEYPGCAGSDVTWADSKIEDGDVEYVRADLASPAPDVQPEAVNTISLPVGWVRGMMMGDRAHHNDIRAIIAAPAPVSAAPKIDANVLEKMAKERPDECFLKGSGVLKLTGAIRQLESEARQSAPSVSADAISILRDAVIDAADQWSQYVEVDNAPRRCSEHIGMAFDAAIAVQAAPSVSAEKS